MVGDGCGSIARDVGARVLKQVALGSDSNYAERAVDAGAHPVLIGQARSGDRYAISTVLEHALLIADPALSTPLCRPLESPSKAVVFRCACCCLGRRLIYSREEVIDITGTVALLRRG